MRRIHQRAVNFSLAFIFCTSGILVVSEQNVLAQETTAITSSGLSTEVSAPTLLPSGQITHDITGGTRPGNGTNLFHSFGEFSVGANNIANFLNETGLPTSNILGRVTGGNISNIFGTIQTTNFGNANLFLMNPAGFLFGPNATVNVGGMVSFSSSDYLQLADGVRFNSTPKPAADVLLSAAPVAAFGFLGSNPSAITVQGSQFSVAPGTGISLVGGNITIQAGTLDNGTVQPARLSAPSGEINLVSVGKPRNPTRGGEINVSDFSPSSTRGFSSLGTIALLDGTSVTASADGVSTANGGTVTIRGGQLMISNSSIRVDGVLLSPTGADGGRIDVHAGAVTLDQATLSATGVEDGNGGQISFMDLNTLTSTQSSLNARTGTNFANPENGGSISIGSPVTKSIALTETRIGQPGSQGWFLGTPSDITLTSRSLSIDGGILNVTSEQGTPGGSITLNANQVAITNTGFTGGNIDRAGGGTVTIQGLQSTEASPTRASSVLMEGSGIGLQSFGEGSGSIVVHAKALTIDNSSFTIDTAYDGDGTINFADVGTLTSIGSNITTRSQGSTGSDSIILGSAATRTIDLQDTSVLSLFNPDSTVNVRASTVNISSGRIIGSPGGQIMINGGNVALTNGALISSSGLFPGSGNAGAVNITATGTFRSTGSTVSALSAQGEGGAISITAGNVLSIESSTMAADSTAGGNAGTIQLRAGKNLKVDNSAVTANSTADGNAGTIELTAGNNLILNNGSTVSAMSDGTGSVGTIQFSVGNRVILRDSVVTPVPTTTP